MSSKKILGMKQDVLLSFGVFAFGTHILLVASIPADFGSHKAASSITGFIDAMEYFGAGWTGLGDRLFDREVWLECRFLLLDFWGNLRQL